MSHLTPRFPHGIEDPMPKRFEDYPTKRRKFSSLLKTLDDAINSGRMIVIRSWLDWDWKRWPWYCWDCGSPVKCIGIVSQTGELKRVQCPVCRLIHFEACYDWPSDVSP